MGGVGRRGSLEGEREEAADSVEVMRSVEEDELNGAVCVGAVSIGSGKTGEVTLAPGKVSSAKTISVKG